MSEKVKSSSVSFTPSQHNFMTIPNTVKEITLLEPTKEYFICSVDRILRSTDPRKYFTER